MGAMKPVAESDGVTIHCPADGRYAFYNSPYPAHRLMTGIDVYPDAPFGGSTPSPVEGTVVEVRRVKAPASRLFESPGYDTVTIIRSREATERVVKLLHVDTIVEEGDDVGIGQGLGPLIRSGYFGQHTFPHVHIEVRPPDDPLRVRGSYHIESIFPPGELTPLDAMRGVVVASRPEYALIQLESTRAVGVAADIGGVIGILDGGIPLYGWFGAHYQKTPKTNSIKLLGKTIGQITKTNKNTCIAQCVKFEITLDETPVNVFFFLRLNGRPQIAVTSRETGLHLEPSSEVELHVVAPADA